MKHLKTILGVMVMMLAMSCVKDQAEGSGQVSFSLISDYEVADQTKSNVSDYTVLPKAEDFIITIKDASAVTFWTGKISEWDAATLLPVGDYTVSASYGSIEEEGFDKPYFSGETDFSVVGAQATAVKINVSLGNTVILVRCTDNFKNYYSDYRFDLVRNGQTIVSFVKGEAKAAFVDGYKISLQGTVTSATKTQSFTKDYTGLKEATAYTVLFDVSNVGGAKITISINNSVETVDLGDIELND